MKLDAHFEAANAEEKQSIQKEIKAWSNGGCCTELDGFKMDLAWIEDGFGMEFGMDSGSRLTNNGAIQQVHLNPCDLLILGTAWSRIGGYSGLRDIYEG